MKCSRIVLGGLLAISLGWLLAPDEAKTDSPAPLKVLSDPVLWGKDFRFVLASLHTWSQIGANTITVFPHDVIATTPSYKTRNEVQRKAAEMAVSREQPHPSLRPEALDFLKDVYEQSIPFTAKELLFREDNSYRVAWSDPSAQFLARSLTFRQVEKLLGPPEKITTRLILTERDGRPIKLILHSYAQGSIIFAASDLSPDPGGVDRVILNVPAIMPALFQERTQ